MNNYCSSKPSVVWHFDEVRDFVQRYLVIVYPPGSLSQAALDAVFPYSGGQVHLAFSGAWPQYGRHDDFFAHGELVFHDVTRGVGGVQHPQGTYQRHGRLQRLLHVPLQQRVYLRMEK